MLKPTTELYNELQEIFDFFNQKLFNGDLPYCLLVLQRGKSISGYFAYSHWVNENNKKIDEIALNPSCFKNNSLKSILSTLVHEMCHLWQSYYGKPGKNGWHNLEWSLKMESLGLMPSHNGKPGGQRTGYKMSDYVIENGCYEKAFIELQNLGGKISLTEIKVETQTTYPRKIKYLCKKCNMKVWGKDHLKIICEPCQTMLQPIYNTEKLIN